MKKQLNRFLNTKRVIYFESLRDLIIDNEKTLSKDRDIKNVFGIYDVLENSLFAVLSFENSNFLFLKDRLIKITKSIHVDYRINRSKEELSFFEVFEGGESIVKIEYVNEHEGVLLPFDIIENWEEVNFGYELASLVNKVKENPKTILFPDSDFKNL